MVGIVIYLNAKGDHAQVIRSETTGEKKGIK